MALTKINFYLASALVVLLVVGGLVTVGVSLLSSPRIHLNNKSVEYIATITVASDEASFNEYLDKNTGESKNMSIIEGDNESTVVNTDQLGVLNYFKEKASAVVNFFKIVANCANDSSGKSWSVFCHSF